MYIFAWKNPPLFCPVFGGLCIGYANGITEHTTYQLLKETKHAETLKITYDSAIISLEEIILYLFKVIDPTSLNKQGNDVGLQYRTGVYYEDLEDSYLLDSLFEYLRNDYKEFYVELKPLDNFIKAEEYHQKYLAKNPDGYCHVNLVKTYTLDNKDKEIIKQLRKELNLDKLSYAVLKHSATETPHTSKLNKEYRKGIYVEKITGEPLFSSATKFDAGCGWPSFSKPILKESILYLEDTSHNRIRTEVRSGQGNNHLGHVFNDGPKDMGGLRYCINGAALDFIPYEEMDEKGYSEYKKYVD
ncbi:peptide methionine sulfoxide reductase msrA/msrB [Metamycoplasma auris]|uniref:Peptide methionine sulfoxide reductase msrA/msrB n=1 Tax=Metamycoplasma auris TaxID=51363 RepID=A0A2W7FUN4_9BACT|nr:peptide methionine sulfoxide reductase msrA/msrB [Metamycoplasma auris]